MNEGSLDLPDRDVPGGSWRVLHWALAHDTTRLRDPQRDGDMASGATDAPETRGAVCLGNDSVSRRRVRLLRARASTTSDEARGAVRGWASPVRP